MKHLWIFLTGLFLFSGSLCVSAQDYWRVVTAEHLKNMSTFERAQYLKGLDLLNNNQFRAASTEFERFVLQYQNSDMKPFMIFLRAYSLYRANDRNKANSVFNEVVDYYPGVIDAAAPAIYYRGISSFENGDYAKGMTSMKEIVDDEDYREHPIAAAASLELVRNYWRNKEPEKAAQYLRRIYEDFCKKSPETAERAQNLYISYCLATDRLPELVTWYMENHAQEAVEKKLTGNHLRANLVKTVYAIIIWNYHPMFNADDQILKYRAGKKNGPDPAEIAWKLFVQQKSSFEKSEQMWEWYLRAVRLNAGRTILPKAEFENIVSEACKFISSVPDKDVKNQQDNRFKELTSYLLEGNRLDQARYVNGRIKDAKARSWNEYDAFTRENKWDDAIAKLDQIKSNFKDDADLVRRAGWDKAWILCYRLGKYDDAIKAYREVANPPDNLWQIAECHIRKKDLNAAVQQLFELENAFPEWGPRSAWRRAEYYRDRDDQKMAIKEGRYIMKKYPKSGESSYAHQMLEKYGIDTGGGVADEEE